MALLCPCLKTPLGGNTARVVEYLPDLELSGPAASPLYLTPDLRLEVTYGLLSQFSLVSHHLLLGPSSHLSLGTGPAWDGVWAGLWFP